MGEKPCVAPKVSERDITEGDNSITNKCKQIIIFFS